MLWVPYNPIYKDGNSNEETYLKSAYKNSLKLAKDYNLKSIAFTLISAGVYGYPKKEALDIVISTIKEFLKDNEMDINLVVFDKKPLSLVKNYMIISSIILMIFMKK